MNDTTQKFTALTGTLLLIVASIFYAVRSDQTIQSSRPPEPAMQSYVPPGHQNKPERLWQDPFDAFVPGSNQVASEAVFHPEWIPTNFTLAVSSSTNGLTNYYALATKSATNDDGEKKPDHDLRDSLVEDTNQIHVLAVMLPGTQLAEDIEARRTTRYSVETALLSSHLAPEDPIDIGASVLRPDTNSPQPAQTNLQVAFEWFAAENSTNNKFLVLWLREGDFYVDALGTLYNVLNFVKANHTNGIYGNVPVDFKLIGPVSSDVLKVLGSSHLPRGITNSFPSLWSHFSIYSPEATAPELDLWPDERYKGVSALTNRPLTQRRIAAALSCPTIQLKNWIATDDQLCSQLVQELANRGEGTVLDSNNVIVLVSEADTTFGRSLPLTFRHELERVHPASAQIWNFEYLRGLDGSKPLAKREEQPAASSSASSSSDPQALIESALRTPDQRAENDAQLDYAERLGEFLANKNRELRRTNGGIMAVGLLGTDVYDKLILLQALGPRLKDSLFFTTDLDARMWMPSKQTSITRNLIVASSYSVEPQIDDCSMDGTFLPFRSVYQTADFLATRAAVKDSLQTTNFEPVLNDLGGHLFEIGRHGPVELLSASGEMHSHHLVVKVCGGITFVALLIGFLLTIGWSNVGTMLRSRAGEMLCYTLVAIAVIIALKISSDLYPSFKPMLAWFIAGFGLPMLAIILCGGFHRKKSTDYVEDDIVLPARIGARDGSKEDPHTKDILPPSELGILLAIIVLACLAFAITIHSISSGAGEESRGCFDGISIWPTEAIRLCVVILSVGYFIEAHRRNIRHYRTLWWDYMRERNYKPILKKIESSYTADKGWNRIRNVMVANWGIPRNDKDRNKVDARMLLAGYIKRGQSRNRYLRSLPLATSYLALAFACVLLLNGMPNRLCVRGFESWLLDNAMMMASIVSFLIALFLSLDGARLTGKLLDGIGSRPTIWPDQLLNEYSSKTGVRPEDLDGYLDVRFAVDKTRESRVLMFFPFVIFLLLLLSRERYIDNWTWTPELAVVFAFNFILAGMCWWIVRRSATKIREEALHKLGHVIKQVNGSKAEITFTLPVDINCPNSMTFKYRAKDYVERLSALHKEIEDERRGAFALWIQDPTYLALFLPTGITGIVAFLVQYWVPHS